MAKAELASVVGAIADAAPGKERRKLRAEVIKRGRGRLASKLGTAGKAERVRVGEGCRLVSGKAGEDIVHGLRRSNVSRHDLPGRGRGRAAGNAHVRSGHADLRTRKTGGTGKDVFPVIGADGRGADVLNRGSGVVIPGKGLRRLEVRGIALGVSQVRRFGQVLFL